MLKYEKKLISNETSVTFLSFDIVASDFKCSNKMKNNINEKKKIMTFF